MKRYKEEYGRYTRFRLPPVEECVLGDCENFQKSIKEKYPDIDDCGIWEKLEEFLKGEMTQAEQNQDEKASTLLKELLFWTEKKDAYSVAVLLYISGEQFDALHICDRCKGEIGGFVRYLRSFME